VPFSFPVPFIIPKDSLHKPASAYSARKIRRSEHQTVNLPTTCATKLPPSSVAATTVVLNGSTAKAFSSSWAWVGAGTKLNATTFRPKLARKRRCVRTVVETSNISSRKSFHMLDPESIGLGGRWRIRLLRFASDGRCVERSSSKYLVKRAWLILLRALVMGWRMSRVETD